MIDEPTRLFIETHLNDDIRQLALKKMPADVDKLLALNQIEARQILSKKVPSWASNPDLMFPKHLSLEQCSSELTAKYKKSIIESYWKINPQSQIVETEHAPSDCETESKTVHAPSVQPHADGFPVVFADLTGGLGIDSYFLSENFEKAYYVENQKDLCDLAENNFRILGRKINVINKSAESFLEENSGDSCDSWCKNSGDSCDSWCKNSCHSCDSWCKNSCHSCDSWCKNSCHSCDSWCKNSCHSCDSWCKFSWLYLDPARRDAFNRKMVSLHDCSPDVVTLQDKMLSLAEHILIKVSPMLDISLICNELKNIKEIHVVSVKNECKEILVLLERGFSDRIKFVCVNLRHDEHDLHDGFEFFVDDEKNAVPTFADSIGKYLYEPNSSLMKAGVFKLVSERFGIDKLHINSHLYTSDKFISDFPGRVFEVIGFSSFDKKVKKELLKNITRASVATRNFPLSANDLRKILALQESDENFVFGTTMKGERKVVVLGKKVSR